MSDEGPERDSFAFGDRLAMRCPECGRSYWADDFERDETYFECNECAVELDSPLQRPSTEPNPDGPELAPMALESDPMNGSQHPASTAPNDVLASPGEAATTADAGGSLADHNGLVLVVIYLALSACTLFDPSLRAINGIPQGAILLPVAIHVITIWGLVDRRLWGLYLAYVFLILRLLGGALVDVNYLSTLDVGPLLYTAVRGLAIPAPLLALIWLSINRRLFDDVSR